MDQIVRPATGKTTPHEKKNNSKVYTQIFHFTFSKSFPTNHSVHTKPKTLLTKKHLTIFRRVPSAFACPFSQNKTAIFKFSQKKKIHTLSTPMRPLSIGHFGARDLVIQIELNRNILLYIHLLCYLLVSFTFSHVQFEEKKNVTRMIEHVRQVVSNQRIVQNRKEEESFPE